MSLRMTEATLKADPSNSNAISLWLAATLKKEILLPTGAVDPSKSPSEQDGLFYARASGPLYLNPVLGRALDDHDSMLALHTISALEATGGVTGLVNGADSPLVRALSYPDRSVRFAATFALARANPVSQFPSFFRIVPILAEAVNTTSAPSALLITSNANLRNHFSDLLHNGDAHYTVYAGETLSDALEQARRAPAFDVVVVPNGPDVGRVSDLSRSDYRLTGIPMLVMSPTDNMNDIKMQQAANKGVAVIDEAADAPAISAALDKIRADVSAVAVSPENASSYAITALQLLDMLASDHRSIYSVNEAVPTLIEAIKDKRAEVVTAAAGVLGKLNSPEAQKALSDAALGATDKDMQITFFSQLAESAKRTGNTLDASAINNIIKIVADTTLDGKVRISAATALGALNVPSNQASTLILQQAR
jgi:hypothetical protein